VHRLNIVHPSALERLRRVPPYRATRAGRAQALAVAVFAAVSMTLVPAAAHDRITTKVTWRRDISPLVQARCASCHASGARNTIALTTYEEVRPWAVAVKEEVLARRMPKWSAARGYGDFANDPSLSPFEIALIAAWVDGGAPETDPLARSTSEPAKRPPVVPAFTPPARTSVVSLPCAGGALTGRLLAVRPSLQRGSSAGIEAILPGNRREIVAWIRNYDPDSPATYWLRRPIDLPAGSRLAVQASPPCAVQVMLAP
jgi:mono/diheme cytochrome c family protein